MQVVSVLSKKPEVLRLIDVDGQNCSRENILAALKAGQDACNHVFLAKVSKLQLLEDAVACELVRGHHPMLSKHAAGAGTASNSQQPPLQKVAPHSRPPQLRSSRSGDVHSDPRAKQGGNAMTGSSYKDTANTFDTDRAAFGSTVARTFEGAEIPGPSGGPLMESSSGDRRGTEAPPVEPARQAQQVQRYTEPSPLHHASNIQANLDSGPVEQRAMGLSVWDVAGRGNTWDSTRNGPTSDVARHRGARESSPDCVDGNIAGPHQLRHASLHSATLLLPCSCRAYLLVSPC